MNWDSFIYFAIPSILLWNSAAILILKNSKYERLSKIILSIGIVLFALFITLLWISLSRPPLRTMGETRLWYSFLLVIVGFTIYLKWGFSIILLFSTVTASVFTIINLLKPEIHDQTLMPALQSAWFVPHVIVYMVAYGILGYVFLSVCYIQYKPQEINKLTPIISKLVYCGVGLLSVGMLFGALWAKQAWGSYWTWDAKETWALITWLIYLLYIHAQGEKQYIESREKKILIIGFIALQMCWYGVNYLPAAINSVHSYN